MKRLLLIVAAAVVGYALYQKYVQDRDERDLWAEVTDAVE
jgi:hypothetical protein